jgi:hypothetical protein
MREIAIYGIAAVVSLAILAYSIHMLVGGLVSAESERMIISGAVLVGISAIAVMARDIVRTRRKNSHDR